MIERLRVRIPAEAVEEFSSSESTYSVSVPPPCYRGGTKDPDHSAKSTGGRLHLNTHTPLNHRSRRGLTLLSRHNVGTYQGNELTRNSSGFTRSQSSQLAEPLWTDTGLNCGTGVREQISTFFF